MQKGNGGSPTDGRSSTGRFKPGVSGNPKGRPKLPEVAREARQLVTAEIENISLPLIRKIADQALNEGCRVSQRLLLERLVPTVRAEEGAKVKPAQVLIQIGEAKTPRKLDEVEIVDVDSRPEVPSGTAGGATFPNALQHTGSWPKVR